MLTWIRLSIPLPEVIIPPSLFTLVGLLVLKTVLLNTCTWPTLFVLASTGNDGAATWSDLGGSSDTDDVIIGYDSAEQLEIQRRLTYSAQIMTKQFSSILNTDWKRLDRILSDSDNWQNAQSKQTSLENMKSVLIEAAARLSDYLTGFAGSVYDTAIAIETHAETFKLSADTGAIKKVTVVPDSLQYDKKRQAYVNFNSTSLHLPVEIWSGSTSMQQELAWSAGKSYTEPQKYYHCPSRDCLNFLHAAWKMQANFSCKTWKIQRACMEQFCRITMQLPLFQLKLEKNSFSSF